MNVKWILVLIAVVLLPACQRGPAWLVTFQQETMGKPGCFRPLTGNWTARYRDGRDHTSMEREGFLLKLNKDCNVLMMQVWRTGRDGKGYRLVGEPMALAVTIFRIRKEVFILLALAEQGAKPEGRLLFHLAENKPGKIEVSRVDEDFVTRDIQNRNLVGELSYFQRSRDVRYVDSINVTGNSVNVENYIWKHRFVMFKKFVELTRLRSEAVLNRNTGKR